MTQWTKPISVLFAASLAFAVIAGCEWGRLVQVDTPPAIAAAQGLEPRLSLTDAGYEYDRWLADVQRDGRRWQGEIERASQVVAWLDTFTLAAVDEIGPQLAGVPLVGFAVPFLAGLAGLMKRRPGDVSGDEIKQTHDSTWNEAFEAGKRAALEGVREARSSS